MSDRGGTIRADAATDLSPDEINRIFRLVDKAILSGVSFKQFCAEAAALGTAEATTPSVWADIDAFAHCPSEEAIARMKEIVSGGDFNAKDLFTTWFEGRPGYVREDWLELLAYAAGFKSRSRS